MYQQAMPGKETALGPDHTSTLSTVRILGIFTVISPSCRRQRR